jgi:hypothetical protein
MRKTWRRWSAAARNGATVATDVLVLLRVAPGGPVPSAQLQVLFSSADVCRRDHRCAGTGV